MKKHIAVIGLGMGDEGKGTLVDRLCNTGNYDYVVRFNGGCQAAHNVVTDDGCQHTFAQFGSGSFHGVPTFLSEHMLVEPLSLMNERFHLGQVGVGHLDDLMFIHPRAKLTTPYHWLVNQYRENKRGVDRHGSCGRGIGATVEYALKAKNCPPLIGDLRFPGYLTRRLMRLEKWMAIEAPGVEPPDIPSLVEDYSKFLDFVHITEKVSGRFVYEGAQGVLLDEHVGFHPHTTWSTVTPDVIKHDPDDIEVIGVTRTYSTRHGAGPLVSEDNSLSLPEPHNGFNEYQGDWRVGHLDIPALRYAEYACRGIDGLYVTHVDTAHAEPTLKVCVGYQTRYGPMVRIQRYSADDLISRQMQTDLLMTATPILMDRPHPSWAESIATLLDVPLFGIGSGPATRHGSFQDSM